MNQIAHWTPAEAYEHLEQLDSASVAGEKLTRFEGFQLGEQPRRGLTHSLAHRRAAKANDRHGDRQKAIEHWRVFQNDFIDPDPEYGSMVEEARAELATLEG